MHETLNKPIGILGGTFDPIHHGHLRMALELHAILNLDKVHMMPCFQPVHRKLPSANPTHRLNMLKCAIEGETSLVADDREITRKTPTYTIDSLVDLRKDFPKTPLCLIIGLDAFLGFLSWHRWRDILDLSHIIIAYRPQYQLPTTGEIAELIQTRLSPNPTAIHERLAGSILLEPITALEISATEIRKCVAMGQNPRYLLPNAVYDYIKQHGIYSLSRNPT